MHHPSTRAALTADRVLDGTGAPAIEHGVVLVSDGRIQAVGQRGVIAVPEDAATELTDFGDATILPGLVDGHTHMAAPGDGTAGDDVAEEESGVLLLRSAYNSWRALVSGVTTARENGSKGRVGFDLRDGISLGHIPGPRMVVCGRPVTMTGGHMWYFGSEADGIDGVRKEVRRLIKEGADYIKVCATGGSTRSTRRFRTSYTLPELEAITDEAHNQGLLVAAHCTSSAGITNSVTAGVDMVMHCVFDEPDGSHKYRPEVVEEILRAQAWVQPTLYVNKSRLDLLEERRLSAEDLTTAELEEMEWLKRWVDARLESTRRMIEAGVRVCAGSDSPWSWYGPGRFVNEIVTLREAGLSADAAIVAATSGSADSIGAGAHAGRLLPDRDADLLIVRANPLEDLSALSSVLAVYKRGHRVAGHGCPVPV